MSGGSFDYLCWHLDATELGDRLYQLQAMADRLQGLDGGQHAARATRDVIRLLHGASRIAKTLEDVYHAVEWWDSGDWSEREAIAELAKFGRYEPGRGGES